MHVEATGGELAVAVRTGGGTVIVLDSLSSFAKPWRRMRAATTAGKPADRSASKAKAKRTRAGVA